MNWVDDLLNIIDFNSIFPRGKKTGINQINIHCPFHDDKHESMSVNIKTGLYYCHTCSEKGNFFTWCKKQNLNLKQIAEQHGIKIKEKTLDENDAETAHQKMIENENAIKWLEQNRGINLDTIKKYKMGIYKQHITIPIYDINDQLVNIRMYNPSKKAKIKVLSWKQGYGSARLFPVENLYKEVIMICEGEMDCILANQLGYNAITGTTGAGTFPREWAKYFTGKKIIICYDIDETGEKAANRIAEILSATAKAIKIIELPLNKNTYPTGDLTDYIIGEKATLNSLNKLIKQTEAYEILENINEIKYHEVGLSEAAHSKYNNKYIKTSALISGKDIEKYIIPKTAKVTCTMSASKGMCGICPMTFDEGTATIKIPETDENLLMMCNVNKKEKNMVLKEIMGIPKRCGIVNIDIIDSMNIEEIILTTEVEYTTDIKKDETYTTRTAYFIGHNIETNKAYTFAGKTIANPKNQYATHLIFEAIPSVTALDGFKMTDKIAKQLKKFQADDVQAKISEIYNNTIRHITGLVGRQDLFILIFLTYCSPLKLRFDNEIIEKGYLETLVLGDTRTGKTEMARSLIKYFKVGELVVGESASFAGLVGGLQQMGNRWHLHWGRIPLNNRRLVIIDEMSGLSLWEIAKLSGIRSEGIAEITKIRTERTYAKTRLIWLSNPRSTKEDSKMLSGYSQGVKAIPELIGVPEDISRFDFILLLGMDDVSMEDINKKVKMPQKIEYTSEDFHNLIMFIWTLKIEDIIFTDEAIKTIYNQTKSFAYKYDQTIPLVIPNSQRIKLAKMAAAAACISFNYVDQKILVDKNHVNFVSNYLNNIYDKPICAYDEYSRLEKMRKNLRDEKEIKKIIKNDIKIIEQLLDVEKMNQTDLMEIFELDDRSETRKVINTLIKGKALKRISSGYEKTRAFSDFLRAHKNGDPNDEDQNQIESEDEINEEIDKLLGDGLDEDPPF